MTNEQKYQKLIDSIQGGKLIVVAARGGIGKFGFAPLLARDVAKKQGMKIHFKTNNPFFAKGIKNKFHEDEVTVTDQLTELFCNGIQVVDTAIFSREFDRKWRIALLKSIAVHQKMTTVVCIPIKSRKYHRRPRLSDFQFGPMKKFVDTTIILHREGFTGEGNTDFSTEVMVIEKGKKKYTFRIILSPNSIDFPKGKAGSRVD